MEKQFVVLYTHQKQKKAKTWHDGCLKHSGTGTRAVLYDEKGCRLDSIHVKLDDIKLGEQLESDRYYILVEEIKTDNTKTAATVNSSPTENVQTPQTSQVTFSRARCAGLKRKKSGFMPPRMVKQVCLENLQNSQPEIDRYTGFPVSSPQCHDNRDENRSRVPLLLQQAQAVKDIHVPFVTKNPETDKSLHKYEKIEKNLFNLYSRYKKQGNGAESENSSQDSSINGENRKVLSPWSVYGSTSNSPSFKRATFREEQLSESPQPRLDSSVSFDKEIDNRNSGRFVGVGVGVGIGNDFQKLVDRKTVILDKLDYRQSEITLTSSKTSRENEMIPSTSKYLSEPKVSDETFQQFTESTKQPNEESKRNITQIMNLLRKKPTSDRNIQDNFQDCQSDNKKALGNELNKAAEDKVHVSTKESVYNNSMMVRESVSCSSETLQEKTRENDVNKAENVSDDKENSYTNILGFLKMDCKNDAIVRLESQKGVSNQTFAQEESNVLEENEEYCADEDLMGSFSINYSPLSHVTDTDDEKEEIDDSVGKGDTASKHDCNNLHEEECSVQTSKSCNKIDSDIGCDSKVVSSVMHSQNVIADEDDTFKAFPSVGTSEEPVLKESENLMESLKKYKENYSAETVEQETYGELELETNIDVLYDIDREFADNAKEIRSQSDTFSGTVLESFEYNNESCNISVVNKRNKSNCSVETLCQQKSDENTDHDSVREIDSAEAMACNREVKVQGISDESDDKTNTRDNANVLSLNCKMTEGVELDSSMFTTDNLREQLVKNNESPCSRTTMSQDTMDFSCNTLDGDSQSCYGIPTRHLDRLVQPASLSNKRQAVNKCHKVETTNSPDDIGRSRYFENTNTDASKNVVNRGVLFGKKTDDNVLACTTEDKQLSSKAGHFISSQQLKKRTSVDKLHLIASSFSQDLEESETEDPVGNLDLNSRTIYSHQDRVSQRQIRGKEPQKVVTSALGSYGTQGISSAVVSRVHHSDIEDRSALGRSCTLYRNTAESPLVTSSPAFDQVYQKQSPFQQLSGSELSEQSSPNFFIDWQNNKPQMHRSAKLNEEDANFILSCDHEVGKLDPELDNEKPAIRNIDEEEIYGKLYRPRLMYQQDHMQNELDCADYKGSGFRKSSEHESPVSLQGRRQLTTLDTCIDRERAKSGSIENSQDSLQDRNFKGSENLIGDQKNDIRRPFVTDFNIFESQSSEEFFICGEPIQSAEEKVDPKMEQSVVNQTPDLDSINRPKNSRWDSFMASQVSDDCDIDMNKLNKKVESIDKSKKGFVALEYSPGLYNTQRVVYQNGTDKETVPASFLQAFSDGLNSQQEDSCSDSGTFNAIAKQNSKKPSNSPESKPTKPIQNIEFETHSDSTFVNQISNNKVAVNAISNEKEMSILIPDTLSSADSLELLLADDDFDIEVVPQNTQKKTSVSAGSEQQVPTIESCNSGKTKTSEITGDTVSVKNRTTPETGSNISQDFSRDLSSISVKENADIEPDIGITLDRCKTEKIIDKYEAVIPSDDNYESENAAVEAGDENIDDLDKNESNAKSVTEFKHLELTNDKLHQKEACPLFISSKQLHSRESGEDKNFDKGEELTIQKNDKDKNNFSLDDSLDLSLSLETSNVSLIGSDQVNKKTHSLRIGWRPPAKSDIQVSRGQSSYNSGNMSQQKDFDRSVKLTPSFKCLRLLAQNKQRINSMNTNGDVDEKVVETETNFDRQQKWKCNSPKQSLVLPFANKRSANAEGNESILHMGADIDAMKPKDTAFLQTSFQDGKHSGTVSNRRFKPPTFTRTTTVTTNRKISSPSFTQRFPVERVITEKQGSSVSQTELRFPSRSEITGIQNILRHVVIPETFPSGAVYKQVLTAALTEYVNTQLFDVSKRFHHALSTVDTSGYSEYKSRNSRSSVANPNPSCQCGVPSKMICVKKEGPNCGRYFYACSADRKQQCKWADEMRRGSLASGSRRKIQDVNSLNMYMKDHHVHFYGECQLIKRTKENINKYFKAPKWARNRGDGDMVQKKQIFLKLPYKGRSSLYAKDDLWIISKHIDFDPLHTFVARSTYYGPSSSLEVEIEPLTGYSPSNWKNEEVCHAILAGNVSTELSCIDNVREHIQTQSPPVIPHLLNRHIEDTERLSNFSKGFQAPRALTGDQSSRNIHIHSEQMDDLSRQYIKNYRLNTDQAEALKRVANMFSVEKTIIVDSILLIHGVFGAGKSYLLSVMVLFLVEVFQLNDHQSPDQPFPWKLLISSTTNVAVDRILIGLLELGFEDFVRVGSVKKIAKPVLPFSVHASGTDNQELKDLQEMLRSGELTATEKSQVRQSIEKHRHGENKKKLGRVRVVGATCASCSLTCLNNMQFPLVLLDECSQMTEPASLLPVARFSCQKLLLVGDPKQLDPTIQGAEAAHQNGLEQTMFDRLIKMGSMPTLLRTQYRCHPYISAVANKLFYGGMLEDGVSAGERKPLLEILPTLCYYDVERGEECCEGAGSFYNEREAQFVVFLLQVLLSSGIESSAVGVITLYRSQMARISDLLTGQGDCMDMKGIQVSTVDAFQGGERDIIILSTVRSQACGFIDNDKRTNVALTRAKHHLLIVGNLSNLSRNVLWAKVINHCKCYENGIQSADEARHSLEKYLNDLKNCETSLASENGKPVNTQNSAASEKMIRKRKPKRKQTLSNTGNESNNEARQGSAFLQNEVSLSVEKVTKRSKKCIDAGGRMDEALENKYFEDNSIGDILETGMLDTQLESSEGRSLNSIPSSSLGTKEDDQLSTGTTDNSQFDCHPRKRPRHVTKLSSLMFDSDSEKIEDDELPAFNCD